MLGKTLADLQSNISISAQNAVTGDINWVTGYTGFSSNFREQAGWYIALKIDASTIEGALEGATIVATYHGRDVTLDSDQIIIIRLADGEDTITFTANKEGYTEGRLTLDFSGLDKQEVNQSVYLTSETTGITISPMQFGNTKTISGQVPWDSTTNTNVMELTAYPFFDVPSGSTYSLEGTYEGAGANIQITNGTFSDLDELDLTFSVPSEMIGQTGATFILMFEDPETNRDYFTYDVTGLTLAPDPRPKFSLTNNTTGVTFTPNGQMAGGTATFEITATGQVPYDTTTSSNLINMTLTTNVSPDYDQTNDSILVAYVDSEETTHTLYTGSLTWSDNVGTATFNCPITADSITYSPVIAIVVDGTNATRVSQVLDTSALTLAPDPTPRINVTSDTTGVTVTPATYNASKTATGQVPYDTTTSANPITFNLAYSGTWSGSYTMVVFYWDEYQNRNMITQLNFTDSDKPASVTFNATATNLAIAIGFAVIQNGSPVDEPEVDTSALTLEPAPNPYQVTGTGLNFDPTATYTVVDQSETVLGSDAIAGCTLDSTTAGTQADPWIANFIVKDLGASVAIKWKVPFTINWDNTTLSYNGTMGSPTGWSVYDPGPPYNPPIGYAFYNTGDFAPVSDSEWSIWLYDNSESANVVKYVHTTLTLAT